MDIPNDTTRIYELRELGSGLWTGSVSQDSAGRPRAMRTRLRAHPPVYRADDAERGMSQEQIDRLLIDNPRRLFSFAERQDDERP